LLLALSFTAVDLAHSATLLSRTLYSLYKARLGKYLLESASLNSVFSLVSLVRSSLSEMLGIFINLGLEVEAIGTSNGGGGTTMGSGSFPLSFLLIKKKIYDKAG